MNKALDAAKKSLMDCYDALAGDYGTSEGAKKRSAGISRSKEQPATIQSTSPKPFKIDPKKASASIQSSIVKKLQK